MPAVFISYSSIDNQIAERLKTWLSTLGFERTFLSSDFDTGIAPGEDWQKRLYSEIGRCHAVILVVTENWQKSVWCQIELSFARALGKVILPVLRDPQTDLSTIRDIQAVDLTEWNDDGLARIERRLVDITQELARGFTIRAGRPPYPGIFAFEADDAAVYYGRDQETRTVIERLDARRMQGGAKHLLIIGASGAGESSLLKAGVLPQIRRRRTHWLPLPAFRPQRSPLEHFAKSIADHLRAPETWPEWYGKLNGPQAIEQFTLLVKNLRVGDASAATVLLPIDQFEELFTVADSAEQAKLLALLSTILNPAHDLPIHVISTGHADVLQGLLKGSDLALLTETIPLLPMPIERVPRLVEGPAGIAGLAVEEGLSDEIERDVQNPDALPLLAYLLAQLYDRCKDSGTFTLDAYRALGDPAKKLNPIQNAIRRGADSALDVRPPPSSEELAALRDAFVSSLVAFRLNDAQRVRQPALLSDVSDAQRLISALIGARLLTRRLPEDTALEPERANAYSRRLENRRPDEIIVEVAHEALFEAWPTLKGWLEEESNFQADLARLEIAQDVWAKAREDKKPRALLDGILLDRAREWVLLHPRRFQGKGKARIHDFIIASVKAADAEKILQEAKDRRATRLRRWLLGVSTVAAAVFAVAAVGIATLYFQLLMTQNEAVAERFKAESNLEVAKGASDNLINQLAMKLPLLRNERVESELRILQSARELLDRLTQIKPNDEEMRRNRAIVLNRMAGLYVARGRIHEALASAQESVSLTPRSDRRAQGTLVTLGDTQLASRDFTAAIAAFEESLKAAPSLFGYTYDDVNQWAEEEMQEHGFARGYLRAMDRAEKDETTINLAGMAQVKIGEAYRLSGNLGKALEAFDGVEKQTSPYSGDIFGLARCGKAKILLANGDKEGALKACRVDKALAEGQDLAVQSEVSSMFDVIGDIFFKAGQGAQAVVAYNSALTIRRRLVDQDRSNLLWRLDLARSHLKMGDCYEAEKTGLGLDSYKEAYKVLNENDPFSTTQPSAHERRGFWLDDFLEVVRRLAKSEPDNQGWKDELRNLTEIQEGTRQSR